MALRQYEKRLRTALVQTAFECPVSPPGNYFNPSGRLSVLQAAHYFGLPDPGFGQTSTHEKARIRRDVFSSRRFGLSGSAHYFRRPAKYPRFMRKLGRKELRQRYGTHRFPDTVQQHDDCIPWDTALQVIVLLQFLQACYAETRTAVVILPWSPGFPQRFKPSATTYSIGYINGHCIPTDTQKAITRVPRQSLIFMGL
jgi:hypothetical protein